MLAIWPKACGNSATRAGPASCRLSPCVAATRFKGCAMHRALLQAGVLTNMVLFPAVPPGEAMLRVSVMATHNRDHLDRGLEVFETVGRQFQIGGPREPNFAACSKRKSQWRRPTATSASRRADSATISIRFAPKCQSLLGQFCAVTGRFVSQWMNCEGSE